MRMLKRAAVATFTAASLTVLGAGVAQADIELNELKQSQTCTYEALIPINVGLLSKGAAVGNYSCVQTGSIG